MAGKIAPAATTALRDALAHLGQAKANHAELAGNIYSISTAPPAGSGGPPAGAVAGGQR